MEHISNIYWKNSKGEKILTEIARKNKTNYGNIKFSIFEEKYKNDLCECGHTRENHKYIESHNYTDGKCLIKGCKCNCLGGWFKQK